eukprot:1158139-Pelagomonas_calceolata.AAC.11
MVEEMQMRRGDYIPGGLDSHTDTHMHTHTQWCLQLRRQLVEETQRRRAEVRSVPLPRGDLRRLDRTNRVARQMTTTVVSSKPDDFEYKVGE